MLCSDPATRDVFSWVRLDLGNFEAYILMLKSLLEIGASQKMWISKYDRINTTNQV